MQGPRALDLNDYFPSYKQGARWDGRLLDTATKPGGGAKDRASKMGKPYKMCRYYPIAGVPEKSLSQGIELIGGLRANCGPQGAV